MKQKISLGSSISILVGIVIAILALVRGPVQTCLLLGAFILWGLWVVLTLLRPSWQANILWGRLCTQPSPVLSGGTEMELEDFYEDVSRETSETQQHTSDGLKKPLPIFTEAAERIKAAGYKPGWINKNVDISTPYTFFIEPKNRYKYRSECPHYQGTWLSGGFTSVKCAVCPIPVPGLHRELTCSKDYLRCPFYCGDSIENYDISSELL